MVEQPDYTPEDLEAEQHLVAAMFLDKRAKIYALEYFDLTSFGGYIDPRNGDISSAAEYLDADLNRRFTIDDVLEHLNERNLVRPISREYIEELLSEVKQDDLWMASIWFYRLVRRAHTLGRLSYKLEKILANMEAKKL